MEKRRTAKTRISNMSRRGAGKPCLTVHEGTELGREYFLDCGDTWLGREEGPEPTAVIPDPSVSRRHARITVPEDPQLPCTISDAGSTNGTFVNGRSATRVELQDGDRIQIGDTVLNFQWKTPSLSRYTRRLYRAATRDHLTDTLNREQFNVRLNSAWEMSRTEGRPLSLIFADLDHFKRINDTYSHIAGDRVLQAAAGALKTTIRKPDVVARYGGEEFAILLTDTDADEALATAERLRGAIEEMSVEYEGAAVKLTLSVGVASCPPVSGETAEVLLRNADAALYQAKNSGRNRCVVWTPQTPAKPQ